MEECIEGVTEAVTPPRLLLPTRLPRVWEDIYFTSPYNFKILILPLLVTIPLIMCLA